MAALLWGSRLSNFEGRFVELSDFVKVLKLSVDLVGLDAPRGSRVGIKNATTSWHAIDSAAIAEHPQPQLENVRIQLPPVATNNFSTPALHAEQTDDDYPPYTPCSAHPVLYVHVNQTETVRPRGANNNQR
jgi:hypothetical protein